MWIITLPISPAHHSHRHPPLHLIETRQNDSAKSPVLSIWKSEFLEGSKWIFGDTHMIKNEENNVQKLLNEANTILQQENQPAEAR